jgi:transcriptional regulator with XRE-family HTH domain
MGSHKNRPTTLVRLKQARRARRLRQWQIGALIGKAANHYSQIERGGIGLSARDALTLCRLFDLTIEELLETPAPPEGN